MVTRCPNRSHTQHLVIPSLKCPLVCNFPLSFFHAIFMWKKPRLFLRRRYCVLDLADGFFVLSLRCGATAVSPVGCKWGLADWTRLVYVCIFARTLVTWGVCFLLRRQGMSLSNILRSVMLSGQSWHPLARSLVSSAPVSPSTGALSRLLVGRCRILSLPFCFY